MARTYSFGLISNVSSDETFPAALPAVLTGELATTDTVGFALLFVLLAVPTGGLATALRNRTRTVAGTLVVKRFDAMTETWLSPSGTLTLNSRAFVEAVSAALSASPRSAFAGRPSTSARTSVTGSPDGVRRL